MLLILRQHMSYGRKNSKEAQQDRPVPMMYMAQEWGLLPYAAYCLTRCASSLIPSVRRLRAGLDMQCVVLVLHYGVGSKNRTVHASCSLCLSISPNEPCSNLGRALFASSNVTLTAQSSPTGTSSSRYFISVTRISVLSSPRSTSDANLASTCICTCARS